MEKLFPVCGESDGHSEWRTGFFKIIFFSEKEKGPFSVFPKRFQKMLVKQALRVEVFFKKTFLLQYDLARKVKRITLIVTIIGEEERKRLKMKGIAHVIYPKQHSYSPLLQKGIGKNTPVLLWTPKALELTSPFEVKHVARHEIIHAFFNSFVFSSLGHANSRHKSQFVENLVDFAALFSSKNNEKIVRKLVKKKE